jgi:hypothetical protein
VGGALVSQPLNDPATHRCKVCGALWWRGYVHPVGESWSLRSPTCGKCCDNEVMGDQIEPLPPALPEGFDGGASFTRARAWTEDRKALAKIVAAHHTGIPDPKVVLHGDYELADAIIAAGFRRPPEGMPS